MPNADVEFTRRILADTVDSGGKFIGSQFVSTACLLGFILLGRANGDFVEAFELARDLGLAALRDGDRVAARHYAAARVWMRKRGWAKIAA